MDPNATLRSITEQLHDADYTQADLACGDLQDWLERGGLEPTWLRYPTAAEYFRSWQGRNA